MHMTTAQKVKKFTSGMEVTTRVAHNRKGNGATLIRIVDLKSPDNDTGIEPQHKLRYMAEIMWKGATKSCFVELGDVNTAEWFAEEMQWMLKQSEEFMKKHPMKDFL